MIVVACGGSPCVFRRSGNQARFECLANMIRTPGSSSSLGRCSLGNARFLAVCRDHNKSVGFSTIQLGVFGSERRFVAFAEHSSRGSQHRPLACDAVVAQKFRS